MSETGSTSAPSTPTATANEVPNTQENISDKQTSSEGSKSQGQELTKAQKEKFKLLVDGQEIEEEIDLSDKESLRSRFQLAAAAKKRMAEAQADKKKAFQIMQEFEANPESFLSRLGPKGREIAEKFLLNQIQDDMLTDEQKELRDLRNAEKTRKEKEAKDKEEAEKKVQSEKEYKIAQEFQNEIIDALKISEMPVSPNAVKRMAALKLKNLNLGLELTSKELAQEYRNETIQELKALVGSAEADQVLKMFGSDIAKKIRLHDIKTLQESQSKFYSKKSDSQSQGTSQNEKGYQTIDEWKEELNSRFQKK